LTQHKEFSLGKNVRGFELLITIQEYILPSLNSNKLLLSMKKLVIESSMNFLATFLVNHFIFKIFHEENY